MYENCESYIFHAHFLNPLFPQNARRREPGRGSAFRRPPGQGRTQSIIPLKRGIVKRQEKSCGKGHHQKIAAESSNGERASKKEKAGEGSSTGWNVIPRTTTLFVSFYAQNPKKQQNETFLFEKATECCFTNRLPTSIIKMLRHIYNLYFTVTLLESKKRTDKGTHFERGSQKMNMEPHIEGAAREIMTQVRISVKMK